MTAQLSRQPDLVGELETETTQAVQLTATAPAERGIADVLAEAMERGQKFSILERRSVDALLRCLTTALALFILILRDLRARAIFLEHVARHGGRKVVRPEKLTPEKLLLQAVKLATGAKTVEERKRASKYARALSHFVQLETPPEDLAEAILNSPGGLAGAAAAYTQSRKAAIGKEPAPDGEEAPEAALDSGSAFASRQQDTTVRDASSGGGGVVIHALPPRSNELRRVRAGNPEGYLSLLVKVDGTELRLIKTRAAKHNPEHHGDDEVEEGHYPEEGYHRRSRKPEPRWRRMG
jgi:hypothetical protein